MSKKPLELSKMSSVEFAQFALQERVAPPNIGNIKERLRVAIRLVLAFDLKKVKQDEREELEWTPNRVRDCWYADPRITPSADQIRDLEEMTGLRYGREELAEIDQYIARADALLDGPDADFYRPFVAAFRAFHRALARPGTPGE